MKSNARLTFYYLTYKLLMEDETLCDENVHQTNKKAYEMYLGDEFLGDPGWNETSVTQSRNYSLSKTKRDGASDMRPY